MKDVFARLGRVRPSPGLVVACLALLVALGGTSYAVTGPAASTRTKNNASPLKGYVIVNASSAMDSAGSHSAVAVCPSGKKVLGGGYRFNVDSNPANIAVQYSGPLSSDSEWDVYGFEDSAYAGNWQVIAWAICGKVQA